MPWEIVHNHTECSESSPWAVVKESDGTVEACHESKREAVAHQAALYANESGNKQLYDEIMEFFSINLENLITMAMKKPKKKQTYSFEDVELSSGQFQPWHGVLIVEGRETGDGREFAIDSLIWDQLNDGSIIPLSWQEESEPLHGHSTVIGRITHIERMGDQILGWGVIDLENPVGAEVARKIETGFAGGISVDVDSVKGSDVELVFPNAKPNKEEDNVSSLLFGPTPEKQIFHKGRIRGATLVAIPAFVEAQIQLIGNPAEALVASMDNPDPITMFNVITNNSEDESMIAAGGPIAPPAEWFMNPNLKQPTSWVVTDEGRVYGHLALRGSCHISIGNKCETPPHEDEHAYYLRRPLKTSDGRTMSVGPITLGTGHAGISLSAVPAVAHYDNTGLAVADVATGNDKFGIWVAGALRPGLEEERIREIRGASLSGDWRGIAGRRRLVAVLGVNVPGFPIPNTRINMHDDEVTSLVAAGIATPERVEELRAIIEHDGTIRVRKVI